MKSYFLLLFCVVNCIYKSNSQSIDELLQQAAMQVQKYQLSEADSSYQQVLSLYAAQSDTISWDYANVCLEYGNFLRRKLKKHNKSLTFYDAAYSIQKDSLSELDLLLGQTLIYQGMCHVQMGNHQLAETLLKKGLTIRKHHLQPIDPKVANVLFSLGMLQDQMGNNVEALRYKLRVWDIYQKNGQSKSANGITILDGIANSYALIAGTKAKKQSVIYYEKAIDLFKELYGDEVNPNLGDLYNNLGLTLGNYLKEYEQATPYLEKAVIIGQSFYAEDDLPLINAKYNLGANYNETQRFAAAHELLSEVINAVEKQGDEKNEKNYLGYFNGLVWSKFNLRDKDYTASLEKLERLYEYQNGDFSKVKYPDYFTSVLRMKTRVADSLYQWQPTTDKLENSLAAHLTELEFIAYYWTTKASEVDKINVLGQAQSIIETAIDRSYQLYEITQNEFFLNEMWRLHELQKNQNLLRRQFVTQRLKGKQDTALDSLTLRDLALRQQIANLNSRLFTQKKNDLAKVKSELFNLQNELATIEEQLLNDFPERNNYLRTLPVPQAQEYLQTNEVLLSYALTPKNLYIFRVQSGDFTVIKKEQSVLLRTQINDFQSQIRNPQQLTQTLNNNLKQLHALLLEDQSGQQLYTEQQKLVIIPDGEINFLPFDWLTTIDGGQKMAVVRHLPSAVHLQLTRKPGFAKYGFAGFAASYSPVFAIDTSMIAFTAQERLERSNAYALPGALNEVEQVSKIMGGKSFLAQAATETNFKKIAADYQILHLALHALVDFDNSLQSALLFTSGYQEDSDDGEMNVLEIQELDTHADLVVLSACNTSMGEYQEGEGILSLNRALHYAGVPATITSLWKVPDKQTAEIMVEFYKNIKAGQDKATALQQAKAQYLKNAVAPELKHPYYWAGFILTGDSSPIEMPKKLYWWWLVVPILLGLTYFFYKKIKKNTN